MPENRIAMYGRKACSAYGWFGKPFRLANYNMPKKSLWAGISGGVPVCKVKSRIGSVVKCVRSGAVSFFGAVGISVAEVLRPVPSHDDLAVFVGSKFNQLKLLH